jgi:hypothetical protein
MAQQQRSSGLAASPAGPAQLAKVLLVRVLQPMAVQQQQLRAALEVARVLHAAS